jgi:hypothetical protein
MTYIWVPRTKIVEIEPRPIKAQMQGQFKIIKRDRWGRALQETPWFSNLILDSGLNRIGTGQAISGAMVGTGTSTPVVSQTALDSQTTFTTTTASGHGTNTSNNSSPYQNTRLFVYRTSLGALNGNYSEVGVGWQSGSCFARELIRDGNNNPTTISVSSSEQLDVYYQLAIYPPLTDTNYTITITGVGSRDITGRASQVNDAFSGWLPNLTVAVAAVTSYSFVYTGAIGSITGSPSGTGNGVTSLSNASYSNNSYTRQSTFNWGVNSGNFAIRSLSLSWQGLISTFQYELDSTFTKTNLQTLSFNASVSWARRP